MGYRCPIHGVNMTCHDVIELEVSDRLTSKLIRSAGYRSYLEFAIRIHIEDLIEASGIDELRRVKPEVGPDMVRRFIAECV